MIPYISLIHLNFGPVTIQTWGLFAALGFIFALCLSLREARRIKMDEEIIWDVMILALLGMIVGSRIFYWFVDGEKRLSALVDLHSGFSLIGGAATAGILTFAYLKYKKQNIKKTIDVLTPGIIVALIFVRTGCLLIGDHIGRITALPWGMKFVDGTFRHPVALYHIIFLSAILLIILKIKSEERPDGFLFLKFCILYSVFGFLADFSRCDDLNFCDPHFIGLTSTQWVLFIFIILFPLIKRQCLKTPNHGIAAKS